MTQTVNSTARLTDLQFGYVAAEFGYRGELSCGYLHITLLSTRAYGGVQGRNGSDRLSSSLGGLREKEEEKQAGCYVAQSDFFLNSLQVGPASCVVRIYLQQLLKSVVPSDLAPEGGREEGREGG